MYVKLASHNQQTINHQLVSHPSKQVCFRLEEDDTMWKVTCFFSSHYLRS